MAKKLVRTTHGFPFWDEHNRVYIDKTPVEVEVTPWLEAQLAAGLVAEAVQTASGTDAGKPAPARGRRSAG
ncbi:hypothetical protein V9W64_10855 [Neisseria leonii]|uniref:Uncharacterized protein n=1 Tax=Neisseria leonii TaxID=2995413 RepID=A0A9X4ICL2_9NEIS|nr:hypothetical protein [Neisseria sp. 51.81]MDD9326741.1 hypothetical protein [Neisseria sp. 51.81]